MQADLEALLERVAAADDTAAQLRADQETTEAEAAAASEAFDALFEQARRFTLSVSRCSS